MDSTSMEPGSSVTGIGPAATRGRMGSRRSAPSPGGSGRDAEDHVYAYLREAIENGLEPGAPLRLSAIAERLGVSTMPVRAALKRLEADGLTRQLARRGMIVAPLELDDIEEIQAIRWGIEGLAARLGAIATSDAAAAAMGRHLERVRDAADRRDPDGYLAATYDLEDTCYAAADRPRLLATVRHHRRAALRYVRIVVGAQRQLEVGPAERFLQAAAARDGAEAERLIQAQIERLHRTIADRMASGAP